MTFGSEHTYKTNNISISLSISKKNTIFALDLIITMKEDCNNPSL